MNTRIPPALEHLVQRELASGEQIVWQARPSAINRVVATIPTFAFGLLFSTFAGFWTLEASGGSHHFQPTRNSGPLWFTFLWGGVFILAGASKLLAPLLAWWTARHTVYVITDRRAILITMVGLRRSTRSFTGDRLVTTVRHEDRLGRGDLIFEREAFARRKSRTMYRDVGFFGLADAKGVEQLLQAAYANYPAARSHGSADQSRSSLSHQSPINLTPNETHPAVAKTTRYMVGFVGFVLCWFVVAVVVGVAMILIFPANHEQTIKTGLLLNWRNVPGIALGLLAGIHSFRASVKQPRR